MLKLVVINLKGGTGKTTSAGYFAAALHEMGLPVAGIDADEENEGFASWAEEGPLPFPVSKLVVPDLDVRLPGILGDTYEAAVCDTPPMKGNRGVVRGAVRWASHVVIPMAPTSAEHRRMAEVRSYLDEALEGRPRPVVAVMFNRVSVRAAATGVYRDQLKDEGWYVLRSSVTSIQRYAQAQGDPIKNAMSGPYGFALEELFDLTPEVAK
ncbi:division plane positioning ATPase MipZ [Lentzea sp. NPDC058450]|uniref:nucleotide-binding protein n=1 Tax=Lentzea sp. NPDC058450 TaxID=3346505 RepID=UPI00365121FD